MDWIKAKYDRLLLGICGVIALVVGGMKLTDVMNGPKLGDTKKVGVKEGEDYGTVSKETVEATMTRLKEVATITAPEFEPGQPATLFSSLPVVKTAAGDTIRLLAKDSSMARPPLPNKWAYEYNLDITRADIADIDSDGDGFTNAEEAIDGSNPTDPGNKPDFTSKLKYAECLRQELKLKLLEVTDRGGISIRRLDTPSDRKLNWTKEFAAGDKFPAARDGDPAFAIIKAEKKVIEGKGEMNVVTINDLKSGETFEIIEGEEADRATLTAKIVNEIGGEELTATPGTVLKFKDQEATPVKILAVTNEEITIKAGEKEPRKLPLKK